MFEKFNKDIFTEKFQSPYKVIYINYDKNNGIEIRSSIESLENSLDDFHELFASIIFPLRRNKS